MQQIFQFLARVAGVSVPPAAASIPSQDSTEGSNSDASYVCWKESCERKRRGDNQTSNLEFHHDESDEEKQPARKWSLVSICGAVCLLMKEQ